MKSPIAAVSALLLCGICSASAAENCKYGLEIMYLQDISDSYGMFLPDLKKQLPDAIKQLLKRKPDAKFGFGTFLDKPLPGLGEYTGARPDYCIKVHQKFSDPIEATFGEIQGLISGGGQDWREAQLDAMLRATVSEKIGWTRQDQGMPTVRIVVVATNSWSHETFQEAIDAVMKWNRDPANAGNFWPTFPQMQQIAESNSPVFFAENAKCDSWTYPEPRDIGRSMKELSVTPVFLVSPAIYQGSCPEKDQRVCAYKPMRAEAKKRNDQRWLDPRLGMQLYYDEMVTRLSAGFSALLKDDMSDLVARFEQIVDFAEAEACK